MLIDVKEKNEMIIVDVYPFDKSFDKKSKISEKIKKDKLISKINNLNEKPSLLEFHGRILENIQERICQMLYHGHIQRFRNFIYLQS